MKYLVLVRYLMYGEWHQIVKEFSDENCASQYAEELYKDSVPDEMNVLIYELKKSYN